MPRFYLVTDAGVEVGQLDVPTEAEAEEYAQPGISVVPVNQHTPVALPNAGLTMNDVRAKRNRLLNEYAWTISAASPLTAKARAEWIVYLKALHKVTQSISNPEQVVWPTPPQGYDYES